MGIPITSCDRELGCKTRSELKKQDGDALPFALMVLDLLGFVLIFVGLAQHYQRIDVLPDNLWFGYSGLIIAALGLMMTVPFLAWSLKTSKTVLEKLSL